MDWIANMQGPAFLGLYAAVILATLAFAYYSIRSGTGGDKVEPLAPAQPNPYEMAYLRGGEFEIGKLLLIELAQRSYIQERVGKTLRGGKPHLRQTESHADPGQLSAAQREVFELVGQEDKPVGELMRHTRVRAAITAIVSGFGSRLRDEGFLVEGSDRVRKFLFSMLVIGGLGGYKLAVALAKGKTNVGFLVVFAVLATIGLWHIVRIRLTWRGRKYLMSTQAAYRLEISDVVLDPGSGRASEVLLHVGLFGAPILFGTAASGYATMLGLDPRKHYSSAGCGSGCGGADSGGGGDGGGCGGGCGGCGGD